MTLSEITIALDVMGGDNAPHSIISGANIALKKHPNIKFLLCGDQDAVHVELKKFPKLLERSEVIPTQIAISSDERPSTALRKSKGSSMRAAIEAVRDHKAHAMVSGGNTGALMAISKIILRPLPGIDRPAIITTMPTLKGPVVMLDMGANVDCNADNLVQFAIMGDAYAKVILTKEAPTIGLLNVGAEEIKGSDIVKAASEELREGDYHINFYGYVEGDDIAKGTTDVVVTDGFTGNITLKAIEGTAKLCTSILKKGFKSDPLSMIGGLLAQFGLRKMIKKTDPRYYNGAMFIGLNGIAVKSHGGTDDIGFSNAINAAFSLADNDINNKIRHELTPYADDEELEEIA